MCLFTIGLVIFIKIQPREATQFSRMNPIDFPSAAHAPDKSVICYFVKTNDEASISFSAVLLLWCICGIGAGLHIELAHEYRWRLLRAIWVDTLQAQHHNLITCCISTNQLFIPILVCCVRRLKTKSRLMQLFRHIPGCCLRLRLDAAQVGTFTWKEPRSLGLACEHKSLCVNCPLKLKAPPKQELLERVAFIHFLCFSFMARGHGWPIYDEMTTHPQLY